MNLKWMRTGRPQNTTNSHENKHTHVAVTVDPHPWPSHFPPLILLLALLSTQYSVKQEAQ